MEQERLPRKEREFLQHRQEILNAALDLFSEKGFHNVTMQEIAGSSEFAVGTLYRFFPNKEDLYRELLEEKISGFHGILLGALEGLGGEMEKITSWLKEKIRIFNDHGDFVRLYFTETMGISTNVRAGLQVETRVKYEDILSKIEKIFEIGIKKKVFKKFDPYHLAVALDGMSNAILFEYLEYPEKLARIEPDLILNIFFNQIHLKSGAE